LDGERSTVKPHRPLYLCIAVNVVCCIQQKDDTVKMAVKRELQMMSAENRLKRVYDNTDDDGDDDDELPLLYPFDADQVPYFACCLLFLCLMLHFNLPHMGPAAVMRPYSFVDFLALYKLFVCLLFLLTSFLPSLVSSFLTFFLSCTFFLTYLLLYLFTSDLSIYFCQNRLVPFPGRRS